MKLAKDLPLNTSAVTQTFAFIGKRGGGKTYAASKLAELMLDISAQVIVLDVVGTWYGLRVPKKKGGKAYQITVFGGLNGDIEINPKAGKIVAGIILERNVSAVVDISQFVQAEQMRFAYDFLITMFEGRKTRPGACHVFLEEAQELVPQNLPKSDGAFGAKMLNAGERLVKLGRNFGIGCSLISQRPQEVNKKVLNQTEVLLAFQMTGLQERRTIRDWVRDKGDETDVEQLLPKLETGEALVWSPTWLKISGTYKIAEKVTADVSATPIVGATETRANTLTKVDVEELRSAIGSLTAEIEANTPTALKKRIAELEKENKALSKTAPVEPIEVEKFLFPTAEVEALQKTAEDLIGQMKEQAETITANVERFMIGLVTFQNEALQMRSMIAAGAKNDGTVPVHNIDFSNQKEARAKLQRLKPGKNYKMQVQAVTLPGAGSNMPEGERKVLIAVAQYSDRGGATREQVSILTGYKKSTRDTYLKRLSGKGFIYSEHGAGVFATDEGIAALGDFEPLPTGVALQEYWFSRLPEGEGRILRLLVGAYPSGVDRETLSACTGYMKSTRDTYIKRLGTKRLLTSQHGGLVTASDDLF